MKLKQALDRLGAATPLLALLLLLCCAIHYKAMACISTLRTFPAPLDPRMIRRVAGIEFIDNHWWFILPFLLLAFGSLIWLALRKAPRWAICITFLCFSLPCFGYIFACLRTGMLHL